MKKQNKHKKNKVYKEPEVEIEFDELNSDLDFDENEDY